MDFCKVYNPQENEERIYQEWENKKLFSPDCGPVKNGKHFSIVLPPPNVTGTLHLGHASMLAIEDLMIRYKKMQGFTTVWIPGTDHASIATQNVVEKKLLKTEGKSRHDFGRKDFLQKVEEHVEESKSTIKKQIKKVGSALDWSREAYTLDELRSRVVRKVFKNMFDDGLIYRGYRIVNWCPRCQSTLADDEVDYKEKTTKFYTFRYDKNFPFEISTTRPETKLGDTAVAVNPQDERYQKFIGKTILADFCGNKLKLKIIADENVDPTFGTGALGVTPAHSSVDYEMSQKNRLPLIRVIDEEGKMTREAGRYFGFTALEAREKIVQCLEGQNLISQQEDLKHNLSLCYRCGTAIEPIPSNQWFVDVNKKITKKGNKYFERGASLKDVALQVVKSGEIKIIPDRFAKTYEHWMDNLHDWCISRQIWFGHRIPVWYKQGKKVIFFRHGQAVGNQKGFLNSDISKIENVLTDLGVEEVKKSAQELKNKKIDLIIYSDFTRTKQTAEILAQELGVSELIADSRWREVGVGDFEGMTDEEFSDFREKNWPQWKDGTPRNIESFNSLQKRVYEACQDLQDKFAKRTVLVVAHGDSIRMASFLGNNYEAENFTKLPYPNTGCYFELDLAPTEIKVSETEIVEDGWLQDEDTLDTWFSSGLWTFSTMLPEDWDGKSFSSEDIKKFHPVSVMETGYDILFFWVARMILMTTYNIGEIPFETVYLHGLIRDKDGDKMSKSKPQTAIDPLIAGEKYGMDAVRLSLLVGNTAGNDIRLYDEKIEGFRNLVNKLWNISRYLFTLLEEKGGGSQMQEGDWGEQKDWTVFDRAIVSKWQKVKQKTTQLLDEYNFSASGEVLREFMWDDLADWYLEISKVEKGKEKIFYNLLLELLKYWQPYIPFVSQAVYEKFQPEKFLLIEKWPESSLSMMDIDAEEFYEEFRQLVGAVRNIRATYKIDPVKKVRLCLSGEVEKWYPSLEILKVLARLNEIEVVTEKPPQSASAIVGKTTIYLPLAKLLDLQIEVKRQKEELANLEKYIKNLSTKLENEDFVKNAPLNIVESEKNKLTEAKDRQQKIIETVKNLQ